MKKNNFTDPSKGPSYETSNNLIFINEYVDFPSGPSQNVRANLTCIPRYTGYTKKLVLHDYLFQLKSSFTQSAESLTQRCPGKRWSHQKL